MNRLLLFLITLFGSLPCVSQQLIDCKGFILSEFDKKAIPHASVIFQTVNSNNDTLLVSYAFSQNNGNYYYKLEIPSGVREVLITVSHISYERKSIVVSINPADTLLSNNFALTPSKDQLNEIIVQNKGPIRYKKDTVEFIADSFRNSQTKKIEDLLKNIDGFKVENDGRITFRGKEVKALLIDGDDLTQDQYQLLSRNLNADLVDRLQVIDNYSKNRILGNLFESNEAAINLILKKRINGRLSGSGSAAASVEGRYEGDAALVWLKSKFKMISLFNSNNISKDAAGVMRYQDVGMQGAIRQGEELTKKLVNGTGIVSTGEVTVPDIPKEFIVDNKSHFISPLLHFRINKSIKIGVRSFAVYDRVKYEGYENISTRINSLTSWSLFNGKYTTKRKQSRSSAIDLIHDDFKRFAGNLNLQIGWVNESINNQNNTSGAFTDLLNENMRSERKGYAAVYSGAFKINEHAVLNLQSSISNLPETKNLGVQTDRLHSYYALGNRFNYFEQIMRTNLTNFKNSFSCIVKQGDNNTFRIGIESSWQKMKAYNTINSLDTTLSNLFRDVSFFSARFNFAGLKLFNRKSSIRLEGAPGIGVSRTDNNQAKSFVLWKVAITYKYKVKAFSGISLNASSTREMPNIFLFHPNGLISANSSVKNGASIVKPVEFYIVSASVADFKIMSKFSLLFSISTRYAKTDYVADNTLSPQYAVTSWVIVNNNKQVYFNFDVGSFVFPLNSTFKLSSNANYSANHQVLNNQNVENRLFSSGIILTWVPDFKLPISTEINFGKNYFRNKQFGASFSNENKNQATNLTVKVRSKFKGCYYIGSQYSYLQLSTVKQIHLWSIFQNMNLGQKISIDITIHNILNNRLYSQQVVAPNTVSQNAFVGVGRYVLCRFNWSF